MSASTVLDRLAKSKSSQNLKLSNTVVHDLIPARLMASVSGSIEADIEKTQFSHSSSVGTVPPQAQQNTAVVIQQKS